MRSDFAVAILAAGDGKRVHPVCGVWRASAAVQAEA
jgi:hypothetical protein